MQFLFKSLNLSWASITMWFIYIAYLRSSHFWTKCTWREVNHYSGNQDFHVDWGWHLQWLISWMTMLWKTSGHSTRLWCLYFMSNCTTYPLRWPWIKHLSFLQFCSLNHKMTILKLILHKLFEHPKYSNVWVKNYEVKEKG